MEWKEARRQDPPLLETSLASDDSYSDMGFHWEFPRLYQQLRLSARQCPTFNQTKERTRIRQKQKYDACFNLQYNASVKITHTVYTILWGWPSGNFWLIKILQPDDPFMTSASTAPLGPITIPTWTLNNWIIQDIRGENTLRVEEQFFDIYQKHNQPVDALPWKDQYLSPELALLGEGAWLACCPLHRMCPRDTLRNWNLTKYCWGLRFPEDRFRGLCWDLQAIRHGPTLSPLQSDLAFL